MQFKDFVIIVPDNLLYLVEERVVEAKILLVFNYVRVRTVTMLLNEMSYEVLGRLRFPTRSTLTNAANNLVSREALVTPLSHSFVH